MTNIFIYLNNKIITCDTILPFINDLKKKNSKINVVFYVFDTKTYHILKQNVNLNNLINNNGKLVFFGHFKRFKVLRMISKIINISYIIISSFFYKTVNIHFKALEIFPFNLIYFFNKKNTYLFEGNCWGWSNLAYKLSLIFYKNRINTDQESFKSYKNLVCFSKEWPQYKFAKQNNKNIFFIKSTRTSETWLDECVSQGDIIVKEKPHWYKRIKKGEKAMVYILGSLGGLPELHQNATGESLFKQTIRILLKETNFVILLKPHAITNIKIVLDELAELKSDRIYLVYNHVAVLSNFCSYAISNYFSFAIIDAWLNGCKTINFTHYSEQVLKLSNNKSLEHKYIDSFINKNSSLLVKELNKPFLKKKRILPKLDADDTDLLYKSIL